MSNSLKLLHVTPLVKMEEHRAHWRESDYFTSFFDRKGIDHIFDGFKFDREQYFVIILSTLP